MEAVSLPVQTADDVARLVRALGKHRYVAGRAIFIHALAADLGGDTELERWARATLADPDVDAASRDERLLRRATEDELATVLLAYWGADDAPRARLAERLAELDLAVPESEPFDEEAEEDLHPLLVDAGWELFPLSELDPERHKGAIAAFSDPLWFESAKFEEENAIPKPAYLQELPAIGPVELLRGCPEGTLATELVLWTSGEPTYQDYVLRGVFRAAKLVQA
jgi:hypothetical protein